MNDERRTLGFHHDERRRKVQWGQEAYGKPAPTYPAVVTVPAWLVPGARIQLHGGHYDAVTVLAADGMLTVVESAKYVWSIDTAILARNWEVAP